MANRTDPLAAQVHGTNPQNLIERILRERIYANRYWKEHCFGLTAATLNPQLHAWWHVLGAVCLHEALACLGAAHALASGVKPQPWMLTPLGSVCSH